MQAGRQAARPSCEYSFSASTLILCLVVFFYHLFVSLILHPAWHVRGLVKRVLSVSLPNIDHEEYSHCPRSAAYHIGGYPSQLYNHNSGLYRPGIDFIEALAPQTIIRSPKIVKCTSNGSKLLLFSLHTVSRIDRRTLKQNIKFLKLFVTDISLLTTHSDSSLIPVLRKIVQSKSEAVVCKCA